MRLSTHTRRAFLRTAMMTPAAGATAATPRPNILLAIADDWS